MAKMISEDAMYISLERMPMTSAHTEKERVSDV